MAEQARAARRAVVVDVLDLLDAGERAALAGIADKLVGAVVHRRMERRAAGGEPAGGWLCRLCDPVACGRPDGDCPAANAAERWGVS